MISLLDFIKIALESEGFKGFVRGDYLEMGRKDCESMDIDRAIEITKECVRYYTKGESKPDKTP